MNPSPYQQQEQPPQIAPAAIVIVLAALSVLAILAGIVRSPGLTATVGGATLAVLAVAVASWITERHRPREPVYIGRVDRTATVDLGQIHEDGMLEGFELGMQAQEAERAARRCRLRGRLTRDS